MPIYEYECRKCGTFEVTQRITESALRRCLKCKGKVTRLLSATSIQFKGSGWYVSDYPSKTRNETATESPDSKGSDSKGPDSKTDSKGAAAETKAAPKESSTPTKKDSKASDTKAA